MRASAPGIMALMAGCASAPPPEAVKDLAPNGTLRAAINVGNAVLAQRSAAGGALERHRQTAAVPPLGDAK